MVTINKNQSFSSRIVSGSCMIAGTAIGAGILGLPLATAGAGFIPASLITIIVWIFMTLTGLLLLEVAFWMPDGSNILSMAHRYLGEKGRIFSGVMFLFLYYCLIIAYLAAGAPLMQTFISMMGYPITPHASLILFVVVIGTIVLLGAKWIDRTNIILSIAMVFAYVLMMGIGLPAVSSDRLGTAQFSKMWLAVPVLFGAFGYHNVIPSLCTYLKRDKMALRISIIIGTSLACLMYLLWIYLVMGSVSQADLHQSFIKGQTAAQALQEVTGHPYLVLISSYFALFAIVTSLLGVSFSVIDFFADGCNSFKLPSNRIVLCLLTFLPATIFTFLNPDIFNKALGLAGGIGESFLNGILPVLFVWSGIYYFKMHRTSVLSNRLLLTLLFLFGLAVMGIEVFDVLTHFY